MGGALSLSDFSRPASQGLVQSSKTLLTSSSSWDTKPKAKAAGFPQGGGSYSCVLHVDAAFEAVRERAKWGAHPWVVKRAVPEIGDVRTLEVKDKGFGHIKIVTKCLRYASFDGYYMYEYRVEESNCMPVGYQGCLRIKKGDALSHDKNITIDYKANWKHGEVSNATQEWLRTSLLGYATLQSASTLVISSWDEHSKIGKLFCGLQSEKIFGAVREKAKWNVQPWIVKQAVPEIGDVRICESSVPGFGHVRTVERCLEYESNDELYMHKYRIDESNLLPVGYEGALHITAGADCAEKTFIEYEASWTATEVGSGIQDLIKATLYSVAN